MYGYWMPAARFNAVKILNYVASSTSNQVIYIHWCIDI